jgi:hypothetical protein
MPETKVEVRTWEHEDFPWRYVVNTIVYPGEEVAWMADARSALFETFIDAHRWAGLEVRRLQSDGKLPMYDIDTKS